MPPPTPSARTRRAPLSGCTITAARWKRPLRFTYTQLHLDGVRAADGKPLLHPEAYYSLIEIPKE